MSAARKPVSWPARGAAMALEAAVQQLADAKAHPDLGWYLAGMGDVLAGRPESGAEPYAYRDGRIAARRLLGGRG